MKKMIFNVLSELCEKKIIPELPKKEIIPDLPKDFPKCYHSLSVKRAFYYSKIAFENGRHLFYWNL